MHNKGLYCYSEVMYCYQLLGDVSKHGPQCVGISLVWHISRFVLPYENMVVQKTEAPKHDASWLPMGSREFCSQHSLLYIIIISQVIRHKSIFNVQTCTHNPHQDSVLVKMLSHDTPSHRNNIHLNIDFVSIFYNFWMNVYCDTKYQNCILSWI